MPVPPHPPVQMKGAWEAVKYGQAVITCTGAAQPGR